MNSNQNLEPQRARERLLSKHNCLPVQYNSNIITTLLHNDKTSFVSSFKDYLIYDDDNEFLKRFYKVSEAQKKLPSFFEFYALNSKIFPNYVALYEAKYLFKNIKRKQKMLDNLREIEENQNVSQSTQSDIFTCNVMGSLCSLLESEDERDIGAEGDDFLSDEANDSSVNRLIDEINKYECDKERKDRDDDFLHQLVAEKPKTNSNHHYVNYYKKYLSDDNSISKSKCKKSDNEAKAQGKNSPSEIKPLHKVATNQTKSITSKYLQTKKKEESKVVLVVKHDVVTEKRQTSTSYHKRSQQSKITVVLPIKENTTSIINKKHTKKIDISSVNEEKKTLQLGFNKMYSKAALTERNSNKDSLSNSNNITHHLNKNNNTRKVEGPNINSSKQMITNKIQKTEAKSLPKSSAKDNLSLFSPDNTLLKSSINSQIAKRKIEAKSKPIIILKEYQINHSNQMQPMNNGEVSASVNIKMLPNCNHHPLNDKEKYRANKKLSTFSKGIPDLNVKFNCRRSLMSNSKPKSLQKKSHMNNNATNNTTHTINDSLNTKTRVVNDSSTKKTSTNIHLDHKKGQLKSKEDNKVRSFIGPKETLKTNEGRPKTERVNLNQKEVQLNCNQKVFQSNDEDMIMMNNKDLIGFVSQKFNHFKSSTSSISNNSNNKTVLNETNRGNEALTTRTEHSNPPNNHNRPSNNKKTDIFRIIKSNYLNNPTLSTLSKRINQKKAPATNGIHSNNSTNSTTINKAFISKMVRDSPHMKSILKLTSNQPVNN